MAHRGSRWSTWTASRSPSTAGRRSGALSERLRLFRAVCEAVQHAHRHAVIHRDLKPSNILVKPDGAVKLLDFGIAKQLEPTGPGTDPTRTGLRLMTPAYAAPEQVEGGRLGVQTDVYALGVLLFELLAGRLPFELAGLAAPRGRAAGPGAGAAATLAGPWPTGAGEPRRLGGPGRALPHRDAARSGAAVPVGRGADPRSRSPPGRRAAGRAAGLAGVPRREAAAAERPGGAGGLGGRRWRSSE